MSKIRHFTYVRSPRGHVVHRVYKTRYSPVEGDRTACGWVLGILWSKARATTLIGRCAKCEKVDASG